MNCGACLLARGAVVPLDAAGRCPTCDVAAAEPVRLAVRPRWRRVAGVPSLYRAHRRLGLARGVAWRLALNVVKGRGGPVLELDVDEAERVLRAAVEALPPGRAVQRAYALDVLADVLALARAATSRRRPRRPSSPKWARGVPDDVDEASPKQFDG